MMTSPNEVELRKKILLKKETFDPRNIHVTDGGMVLHKTCCPKHITYKEICQHYVQEIRRNYGKGIIAFDDYDSATTKNHAHVKRRKKSSANIEMDESINAIMEKDEFLSNEHNISKLIEMMKKFN